MLKTNLSPGKLAEPLTRRESAILAHLVADKSNQEIAALENLALNSVKWYIQQLYAKLGVNKRGEAVDRARELGLLNPSSTAAPDPEKNNLPAQLTSFIGREKEIAGLVLLLRKKETRLVTLTGSGGTGKTRLSLQVAVELLESYPDGVWLVELAPLADPSLIPQTVITALGQVEQVGKPPISQLADYLRTKQLLLILDNCEHLVEACAGLVSTLLHSAPRLTIMASSREILGVPGEMPYRVPPMGMPDPHKLPPLDELAKFDAVRLFVERARVVDPDFALREDNAADVARIVQRLDGIPLALELAAARVRLLSAGQIALRLHDAFRLLTGGSRTALPRHQTLTALIDWSYNLLSEAERELLCGLSAFAGGWTLEAAEEVCGKDGDVLDLLGQLADKSLILAGAAPDGEKRYRMLETIRQYAHARLVETGEAEVLRKRHLVYYLNLAERLEPKLRGGEQIPTLNYWESELDNLRLALEWALQADLEAELRLVSALHNFWHIRYHWGEAIAWLEQGLEAEALSRGAQPLTGVRAVVCAKALTALGIHLFMRDEPIPTKAEPALEKALFLYRESHLENRLGMGMALRWLGWCKIREGDCVQARRLIEEALNLLPTIGDIHGTAESLNILGGCEIDLARQKKIFRDALAMEETIGDSDGIATSYNAIGLAEFQDGDYTSACAAFEASREHYRRVGNPDSIARLWLLLAIAALYNGELERADQCLEKALVDYREMANDGMAFVCHFEKCLIALAQGRYDLADELAEDSVHSAQKTGDPDDLTDVLYLRARLARLHGDTAAARRYATEGIQIIGESGTERWLLPLELGRQALQDGDLSRAGAQFRESLQLLIRRGELFWLNDILDGLAVLGVRQGRLERAARLFGTRLWRGFANTLSPIERAEREADFEVIKSTLGEERYEQLQGEGDMLSFMQVLALAQEEI